MIISGFQTTTLLDFPGRVACTVFTGGCNFRCPFCHNGDIVLAPSDEYKEAEIMAFLEKRKKILDGVCVTGGEPTLHSDLPEFIKKIKSFNLLVKLDTNGSNPDMLGSLIDEKLVDYVAMDIKAGAASYGKAVGIEGYDISNVKKSIQLIMESGLEYEFRTTLVKGIHTKADIEDIGGLINGAEAYFLQSYRENDKEIHRLNFENREFSGFSDEEMLEFLDIASKYCKAYTRGID